MVKLIIFLYLNRIKHLNNCHDESVKFTAEKEKLSAWLHDAEMTLNEMHKRTNQLSRLRDISDRYRAFQSEVITHQADMRFIDLSAQKFIVEADNYRKRLMTFKAETQNTRSSLILDDEEYGIKKEVADLSSRFQALLADCASQVSVTFCIILTLAVTVCSLSEMIMVELNRVSWLVVL